ncbi:MAG TPA: hypothetical protein VMU81_02170 [Acetobacteraceae bacterium]|nr:hypothetical protein [Acetobacteraceae bacterium]
MDFSETWANLTQAQGTVIGAVITMTAAVGGVILGWLLFSGRVKSLEEALKVSEASVQNHLQDSESRLQEHLRLRQAAFDEYASVQKETLSSLMRQLTQVSGSVADIPTSASSPVSPNQQEDRDSLRADWTRIRDHLDTIADDAKIDGRTRAKYARVDRRQYGELVTAMDNDHNLDADAALYREAIDLWHKFRNGRSTPSKPEVQKMQELAEKLTR